MTNKNETIRPDEIIEKSFEEEHPEIDFRKLDELSDDEAILALDKMVGHNDKIIEQDYLSSLLDQGDRLLYYEVENIYRNYSKKLYKNRLVLKKDPPILKVKDDLGNEAEFYLTENFVDELDQTLKQVQRAYYGYSGPEDLRKPDKFIDKIGYYAKKHPLKLLLPLMIIIFIILKLIN